MTQTESCTTKVSTTASAETRFDHVSLYRESGLGVVCRATDTSLNREVALKIIKSELLHDREAIEQFEGEAEITGRLVHPGIAPVYSTGKTPDGNPFYAMQFVEGIDFIDEIDAFYRKRHPSFDGVAFSRLVLTFASACRTIAYAHSRGIIHRNITPQNIRVGKFNEVFVLDWGLAISVEHNAKASAH
ncbi:MAG: protein kinase [Planctomycetaceae bacterium]